jgi:hypothetical protein
MLKLAIVGSHKLTAEQTATAVILVNGIISVYRESLMGADLSPLTIVSGGASGVDTIAEHIAVQLGLSTEIYHPAHPQWEPKGYKDRNVRIAESCDELWCIRARDTTTGGSQFTANHARALGKTVHQCWI